MVAGLRRFTSDGVTDDTCMRQTTQRADVSCLSVWKTMSA